MLTEHYRRLQMEPVASDSTGLAGASCKHGGATFVLPSISCMHTLQTYDRFIPSRSAADSSNPHPATDRLICASSEVRGRIGARVPNACKQFSVVFAASDRSLCRQAPPSPYTAALKAELFGSSPFSTPRKDAAPGAGGTTCVPAFYPAMWPSRRCCLLASWLLGAAPHAAARAGLALRRGATSSFAGGSL